MSQNYWDGICRREHQRLFKHNLPSCKSVWYSYSLVKIMFSGKTKKVKWGEWPSNSEMFSISLTRLLCFFLAKEPETKGLAKKKQKTGATPGKFRKGK